MRDRSYGDQTHRASGLNVLCAAIAPCNTVYVERSVEELRVRGRDVTDEHLSPLGWEHVALTGVYRWDPGSVPQPGGLRPLRS